LGFTLKILYDKIDSVFISKIPLKREVTEQPIFFLALVAHCYWGATFPYGIYCRVADTPIGVEEKISGD
jgi:hypothetical protein